MILPIGHEQSTLRRLPWVTFSILALCVIAFLATNARGKRALAEAREGLDSALRYYLAHPYLELDGALLDRFLPGGGDRREALLEGFRTGAPGPADAEVLAAEQAELDRLAGRAVAAIESHPLRTWGFVPSRPGLVDVLVHMFLHGGWLHLLGNLLILYLAAPYIEDVWGRPLFAGFYIAAGIAAALVFAAGHADSSVPVIGASGAIAGVMGAFLVRHGTTRIRFFYMFGIVFRGTFDAPAWVMLPLWFGQQMFLALLTAPLATGGGVAYLAHVGGFAFGIGAALAIRHFRVEERWIRPALESRTSVAVVANPVLERAAEAEGTGRSDDAFRMLSEEALRRPSDEAVAIALWDLAGRHERWTEAAPALEGCIRDALAGGRGEAAVGLWRELSARVARVGLDAPVLLRLAHALIQREGEATRPEAARTLRQALLRAGTSAEASLVLKIARLARDVDPETAGAAARLALAKPGLDPVQRQHAERVLAAVRKEPVPV